MIAGDLARYLCYASATIIIHLEWGYLSIPIHYVSHLTSDFRKTPLPPKKKTYKRTKCLTMLALVVIQTRTSGIKIFLFNLKIDKQFDIRLQLIYKAYNASSNFKYDTPVIHKSTRKSQHYFYYFGKQTRENTCVTSRHQQPTDIRTWVDSPLRVARQCSNRLGQRARPSSERLVGQLDCQIPLPQWHQTPLSDNPAFSPGQKHDNQSALSELSTHWALPRPADEPPM